MRVIYSIHNINRNASKISHLDCVFKMERRDGKPYVYLKKECTMGLIEVFPGDWLVQYKNGRWQRFGSSAYNELCKKATENNGRHYKSPEWTEK